MATGDRIDPYRGYNFRVELGGTAVAAFREVKGLSFTIDPIEYREGTDVDKHARKLPGQVKYGNIVCNRGLVQSLGLWTWFSNVVGGQADRRAGAIVLQDEVHTDVLRWSFQQGWICKWEGPAMNATANEVAVESIEICVERVDLSSAS
jgi:phage tail-like protein